MTCLLGNLGPGVLQHVAQLHHQDEEEQQPGIVAVGASSVGQAQRQTEAGA